MCIEMLITTNLNCRFVQTTNTIRHFLRALPAGRQILLPRVVLVFMVYRRQHENCIHFRPNVTLTVDEEWCNILIVFETLD